MIDDTRELDRLAHGHATPPGEDSTGRERLTIFTIGHSNHPIEAFLQLLAMHRIEAVADVRSFPFSRRFPHFNREPLAASLEQAGIAYVFLGDALGARPREPSCYVDGRADLARIAERPAFRAGIERLLAGARRYRLALMCAEAEPLDCHRGILVAPRLAAHGVAVRHILRDGRLEPHEDSERRLLEPSGAQLSLFDSVRDFPEWLNEAYSRREREIAPQAPMGSEEEDAESAE